MRGHKYVIPDVIHLESAIIVQQGNQKPTNILNTHTHTKSFLNMRKIEKNPTHNGKNKVPKKKDGEPATPR